MKFSQIACIRFEIPRQPIQYRLLFVGLGFGNIKFRKSGDGYSDVSLTCRNAFSVIILQKYVTEYGNHLGLLKHVL